MVLFGEAHRRAAHILRARIRRHHQDDVAEVRFAPVVVRQRAVVHDLKQQVEDLGVRFLDLIQQHDAVRMLGHSFGEQSTLIEANVAWGRADEARNRVALHVLGHVVAQQLNAHDVGQLAADFGFAHAGGAGKQERTDGLLTRFQPRARQLDRRRELINRFVLPKHHHLELLVEITQRFFVRAGDLRGRDACDLGNHLLDVRGADALLASAWREQLLSRASLIDHIDRLVRHEAVVDVLV